MQALSSSEKGDEGPQPILQAYNDEMLSIGAVLRQTMEILIPTDVSSVLWMSSQMITMMFVGHHLGEEGMSQYSAGVLIFNVMAMSIITGLGSAIDTIGSQAFGQDPRSPVIDETLQRALVIDFVLWVIMSIAFLNCRHVMVLVFGEIIGDGAARFLAYCPLYLLAQIISGTVSKTLFAQRLPLLVSYANGVAALISPLANYFLTPMGVEGAALSLTLTVGFCAATNVALSMFHPKVIARESRWPSPALRRKEGWITFMKVGLPSMVAVCAEWWAFEVQAFFAVSISPLALAVFGVAMSIVTGMFSLALGMSVAASVVIGNALGARKPVFAAQYSRFIIICDLVLGACVATLMGCFGGHIARLYTNVPEVASAVESTMPLITLLHVGDSFQFCLQGIFRGAGRPEQAARGVLFTLWLVGMPASALYVFVFDWGVKGVIGGLLTGFLFEIPLLCIMISRWDWNKLVEEAQFMLNERSPIIVEEIPEISATMSDSMESDNLLQVKAVEESEGEVSSKCIVTFRDGG